MVARWIPVFESYNLIIEYRKGSQHTNADALSRKPYRLCKREDCSGCDTNVHKELRIWTQDEIKSRQENDVDLSKIVQLKIQFDE